MYRRPFALEIAKILRVGRYLDGDELIRPYMVPRSPDLAERAFADLGFQNVFTDSLFSSGHSYSTFSAIQSHVRRLYIPASKPPRIRKVQAVRPAMDQSNSHPRSNISRAVMAMT